jgi:hypothetical protein
MIILISKRIIKSRKGRKIGNTRIHLRREVGLVLKLPGFGIKNKS